MTGVPIPHIKANRTVEIYEERMETNEENNSTYYVFDWKSTTHSGVNKFDEVHSTNLVANCKVGEFEIDGQIINGISVGKKLKDIDNQAIAAKGYREHYEHKKDITYGYRDTMFKKKKNYIDRLICVMVLYFKVDYIVQIMK